MFLNFTKVIPGHDCMFAPCKHDVKGEHGIHGDEIHHAVKTELADGRAVFLVLRLFSEQFPDTVPPTWAQPRRGPRPVDVALHVQAESGQACEWTRGACNVVWDTTIEAREFERYFVDDMGMSDPVFQFAKAGPEAMWTALRELLQKLVADPMLFAQPDETDIMRDVRTREEQASAALKAAQDRYQVAQKDLWHAIGLYTKGDPGYRRR